MTTTYTLIEETTYHGAYDMIRNEMIIDHPRLGRLLLAEGFGGMDSIRGGQYRWEHGIAVSLRPEDTLETLEADWNEWTSLHDAVLCGEDTSRPVLSWTGEMIRQAAEAAK